MISELNSQLIVHHPYRFVSDFQVHLGLTPADVALAWSVINDHYLTDLPLLHPPHIIAVMAIIMAVVFKPSQPVVLQPGSSAAATMRDNGGANMLSVLAERTGSNCPPRVHKVINWLANSEVEIEAVIECSQEIISLYEVWEQYSEKTCKDQISRFVKARVL